MKIVIIGPYPLDETIIRGGVESSVYGLVIELAKEHQVYVMDFPRQGIADSIEDHNTHKVYRFHNGGAHQKDIIRRINDIVSVIKSLSADICHIHGTNVFSSRLFDRLENMGTPTLVTVHGLLHVEKQNSLKKHFSLKTLYQFCVQSMAERHLLNRTKMAIVDTHYVEDKIIGLRLENSPILKVIPQGISDSFFNCPAAESSNIILSVGAFSMRKGQLLLVKTFEEHCRNNPALDTTLLLCGSIADKEYFDGVTKYVDSSPYRERIMIKTDLPHNELVNYYQKAHIFALHSQEESQGIVLAEAMAVGLPVVATKVGGIPYVVRNEVSGLLTDYGDIESFAHSIDVLFSSMSIWKTMSEESKKLAAKYSWKTISESVCSTYKELISLA